MTEFRIERRLVGDNAPPLVIAEIGINHEGDVAKAIRMVDDAARAGCECVKFQCHVIDDEMNVDSGHRPTLGGEYHSDRKSVLPGDVPASPVCVSSWRSSSHR